MHLFYSIQLLFFIITLAIYILVLICLFQGWRCKGSGINVAFSKICFVTGICDILTLSSNNLLNILPKACFFPEFFKSFEGILVHIYLFFGWGGGTAQGLCCLAMAFNRLSTVLAPDLSAKYWNSKFIYLIFALQTIPGILVGSVTLPFDVRWKQNFKDCGLVAVFVDANIPRLYFKIAAVFLFIISLLLIIFYSIILIALKRIHKLQLRRSTTTTRILYRQIIRESRLLAISSIICAIQIIYVIYIALREITRIGQYYIGVSIIGDICAGINPYLLLIFSPITRKRALKFFNLNCTKLVTIKIQAISPLKPPPS